MSEVLKRLWAVYRTLSASAHVMPTIIIAIYVVTDVPRTTYTNLLRASKRQLREDQPDDAAFPCSSSNSGKPDMPMGAPWAQLPSCLVLRVSSVPVARCGKHRAVGTQVMGTSSLQA